MLEFSHIERGLLATMYAFVRCLWLEVTHLKEDNESGVQEVL